MLAFATLGCPGLPLDEVIALAQRHGCDGVEFRYAEGEPVHPGLSTGELASIGRRLADAGVVPLALDSYLKLAAEGPEDPAADGIVTGLREHLAVAASLGARYLRVFPGADAPDADADRRATRRLVEVASMARDLGVGVLLETHDSHRRAADVARVLTDAAQRGVAATDGHPIGAIWDVMHTWRGGETPAASLAGLAPWLGYVQLKDCTSELDPVAPGAGVLPLPHVLAALRRAGYQGWISLEYERMWHPEIPPLADALPAFTGYLAASD